MNWQKRYMFITKRTSLYQSCFHFLVVRANTYMSFVRPDFSLFYQEIFVNCIICVFTSSSYRIQVLVLWRETEELRVRVIAFNATFNNISGISCRSVLLVEETGVPRVNHRPAANHWQIVSHNVVSSIPRHSNSQR